MNYFKKSSTARERGIKAMNDSKIGRALVEASLKMDPSKTNVVSVDGKKFTVRELG